MCIQGIGSIRERGFLWRGNYIASPVLVLVSKECVQGLTEMVMGSCSREVCSPVARSLSQSESLSQIIYRL